MDKLFDHYSQLGDKYADKTERVPSLLITGYRYAVEDLLIDKSSTNAKRDNEINKCQTRIKEIETNILSANNKLVKLQDDKNDCQKKISDQPIILEKEQLKIDRKIQQSNDKVEKMIAERDNPNKKVANKGSKWNRNLNRIIFWNLTISLLLFYWSAWYNGLFSNFFNEQIEGGSASSVLKVVMNPYFIYEAIVETYNYLGLIFSLVLTSIPLGVATLLHEKADKKSNNRWGITWTSALSLIIALVLDFILAYKIVEEIYNYKRFNGVVANEAFSVMKCFSEITFYLIFLISFVTYFVWGIFYSKMTKQKDTGDVINAKIEKEQDAIKDFEFKKKENGVNSKLKINKLEERLNIIKNNITLEEDNISSLKNEMTLLEHKITLLREKIPLSLFEINRRIDAFFVGWITNYNGHQSRNAASSLNQQVEKFEKYKIQFLQELKSDDRFFLLQNSSK
jgi:hypothetical protein